jgi:hypothetical protein
MVSGVSKPKREKRGSGQQQSRSSCSHVFAATLERAAGQDAPKECYTVTYDRSSRLQTYYYRQSKEYTF